MIYNLYALIRSP